VVHETVGEHHALGLTEEEAQRRADKQADSHDDVRRVGHPLEVDEEGRRDATDTRREARPGVAKVPDRRRVELGHPDLGRRPGRPEEHLGQEAQDGDGGAFGAFRAEEVGQEDSERRDGCQQVKPEGGPLPAEFVVEVECGEAERELQDGHEKNI